MAAGAERAFHDGTLDDHGNVVHRLCPSASSSVPTSAEAVRGYPYQADQSMGADYARDAKRHAGFACLGYSRVMPQHFMYSYSAHGSGEPGDGFAIEAIADFDGDGDFMRFRTTGTITAAHTLEVSPIEEF
jgi:hypothetical protein